MSSSASPTPMKFEIQKLEGASNYITWKASMTIYLDYYDRLDVVNGSEPYPTEIKDAKSSATVSPIKASKKKDNMVKICILTLCQRTRYTLWQNHRLLHPVGLPFRINSTVTTSSRYTISADPFWTLRWTIVSQFRTT
jgi:hypothetical protein